MIEMAMFFGLGFFTACLATIFVANAVWRRAVRLTTKRVQASMPISLAEIKADRDQLRADFAMSTRKLELSVDELKQKMQSQVTEIAKKNEQIRLLLLEVKTKSGTIRDLEQREHNQRFELLKSESELGEMVRNYRETEKKLTEAQNFLAERDKALANSQSLADQRRVELSALNTKISQLQYDLSHIQKQREALEADHAAKHDALAKTERELADERAVGKSMATKLEALESTVQSQALEIGQLQGKISELSAKLKAQMAETERMSSKAQTLLAERNRIDEELARRTGDAELRLGNLLHEAERVKADVASKDGQINALRAERDRLARQLKDLESGAQDNWAKERSDNALLRERINDIASEISTLGSAIIGEDAQLTQMTDAHQAHTHNHGSPVSMPQDNPNMFGRYRADTASTSRKDALPNGMVPSVQQTTKNGAYGAGAPSIRKTGSTEEFRNKVLASDNAGTPRRLTLSERMKRLQEKTGA